VGLEKRLIIN